MQTPLISHTAPGISGNTSDNVRRNLTDLPEATLARICDALDGPGRQAVAALGNRSLMAGLMQPRSHHLQARLPEILKNGLREPHALSEQLTRTKVASGLLQQTLNAATGLQLMHPIVCPQAIVDGIKRSWDGLPPESSMSAAAEAHAQVLEQVLAETSGPLHRVFEQLWYVSAIPSVVSVDAHHDALFRSILRRTRLVDLRVLYLQGKDDDGSLWEPFTSKRAAKLLLEAGHQVTTLRLDWYDVTGDPSAGVQAVDALLRGMPQLTSLDVRHNRLGGAEQASAMQGLLDHPVCASLEVLRISGHAHSHDDPGTDAFLESLSVHAKRLKHLEIDGLTFRSEEAAVHFAHQVAPLASRLTSLVVSEGYGYMYPYMDEEGYRQLAAVTGSTPVVGFRRSQSVTLEAWIEKFEAMRPAPLRTLILQERRFESLCEADGWIVDKR